MPCINLQGIFLFYTFTLSNINITIMGFGFQIIDDYGPSIDPTKQFPGGIIEYTLLLDFTKIVNFE